jgi:type III restriction enzyme
VAVQKTKAGQVNWIIETKGRVWEGTTSKDDAMCQWCERITEATGTAWRYLRVDQAKFDAQKPITLADLASKLSRVLETVAELAHVQ